MKKLLLHSFSFHHDKYMKKIHEIFFTDSIFLKQEDKNKIKDYYFSIGVTNSYLGFETTRLIKEKSRADKLISLCHSTFGGIENINGSKEIGDGYIFAAPKFWKVTLPSKNLIQYHGHHMMLHHYYTPPTKMIADGVLYLPPCGIKDINEVKEIIKNIKQKVYIKPHPIAELNAFPEKWADTSKGLLLKDFKKLENSKVKVITSKDITLEQAIDAFDFIIGTPPTSALIEAVARSAIYGKDKRVIYTNNMEGIPEKYGMHYSSAPCIKDFGIMDKQVLDSLVIGKREQVNEIRKLLR